MKIYKLCFPKLSVKIQKNPISCINILYWTLVVIEMNIWIRNYPG